LFSCSNNSQRNQDNIIVASDSIFEKLENNQVSDIQEDTTQRKKQEILNEEEVPQIQEYYDYYSEVEMHYKYYIEKAYDKKTYQQYFATRERHKLDSLIKIYGQKE
jgi:hypothetical protein